MTTSEEIYTIAEQWGYSGSAQKGAFERGWSDHARGVARTKAPYSTRAGGMAAAWEAGWDAYASLAIAEVRFFFDREKRRKWFTVGALAKRELTEAELVGEALRLRPGMMPAQLARDGAVQLARQIVTKAKSPGYKEIGRSYGAADKRIAAAFQRMVAENKRRTREGQRLRKITSATLCAEAHTNQTTAARWLEANGSLVAAATTEAQP